VDNDLPRLARWLVLERCWRSAGYSHFCSGVHDRCSLCRLCSSIDVQPALFIGPRKQGRQVVWRNHTVRSVPMRLSDTCRTNDSRLDSDTRNERRITAAMLEIEKTDTFRPVRQSSQIWLQTCSIQMGRVRPGFVHASATRETCPHPAMTVA
jgi:hypothetical protein